MIIISQCILEDVLNDFVNYNLIIFVNNNDNFLMKIYIVKNNEEGFFFYWYESIEGYSIRWINLLNAQNSKCTRITIRTKCGWQGESIFMIIFMFDWEWYEYLFSNSWTCVFDWCETEEERNFLLIRSCICMVTWLDN